MNEPRADVAARLLDFRPVLLSLAEAMISSTLRGDLEPSDLVQQTLLEAHCNAEQLAVMSQTAFFSWLRNALNHNVLDAVKHLKAQKNDVRRRVRASDLEASFIRLENILIADETSPSEVVQRKEQICTMLTALQTLPDHQRKAVILKHLNGRSLKDIAEVLGLSNLRLQASCIEEDSDLRNALKAAAMTDNYPSNHASDQNEETLTDELLAKLEQLAEKQTTGFRPDNSKELRGNDAGLYSEHLRLYEFLDKLTSPVRQAFQPIEALPALPEYEELEEIARGGMGVVYRSMHKKMRRIDAIKVIRPDRLTHASPDVIRQMQQRFERELRLAAYVAHEHIVPVYQVGETDDCVWFSMQFVNGATLHSLSRAGAPALERVARYIEKIARAVHTVHGHGILHGDIKPQNILIETETDRPLLSDFGVAELLVNEMLMASTGVAGTPAYMAPELTEAALRNAGSDEIAAIRSVSSDVYSLGATLWAALTGESPRTSFRLFEQTAASHTMASSIAVQNSRQVPQELLRICGKAMAHDPSVRQASAGEFADDLATWLNRPRWNRFFPGLRHLLWMVVAPLLFANGMIVWLLVRLHFAEPWIWLSIFSGYVPLFVTFSASQQLSRSSESARRELWSIWSGHAVGSFACFICLRIMFPLGSDRAIEVFYPCWAVISSVAFFAKSGNFWAAYRWIGAAWSAIAVLLAVIPMVSPIAFGIFAALTCIIIARGDREFWGA